MIAVSAPTAPWRPLTDTLWSALDGPGDGHVGVTVTGSAALPSPFPVSDLAAASVGVAARATAELIGSCTDARPVGVRVDREAAGAWFGFSLRPQGWELPAAWDPIAGNYRCADGWVRLHTNVPAHRAAALAVLGVAESRAEVERACRSWSGSDLEDAVVARGGCAAVMRGLDEWRAHPQGRVVAEAPPVALRPVPPGAGAPRSGWRPGRDRPLDGIRVLDLTRVLAGPVATRTLAGLGATVLRLDPLGWEEPGLVPEVTPGKHCARLDLGGADARTHLEDLLGDADVLVHSLRPGALEALGLGPDRRAAIRPDLVDVELSAYGWTGPWAGRRGFDSVVQMSAGLSAEAARRTGTDAPVPLPVQALDHAAGYVLAAGALRGLTRRHRGEGGLGVRVTLAGMAHLLATAPGAGPAAALDVATVPDAAGVEHTAWGPAARMVPPFAVDTADGPTGLRWARGAVPLGHDAPVWPVAQR